jgi:hypothetical protein
MSFPIPGGAMIPSEIKKHVRHDNAKLKNANAQEREKCAHRKSKELKYDVAVPGDRGDCEKESFTQGSE